MKEDNKENSNIDDLHSLKLLFKLISQKLYTKLYDKNAKASLF